MAIAFDRVQKPLRKLRKALRNLPADPAPEQVHKLRTRSRQIEAIAAALPPSGQKLARRLLKSIKPLRKAAGSVRDMDVLTRHALTLPPELYQDPDQSPRNEASSRLIEHLELSRKKHAAELLAAFDRQRKTARRSLKLYAKQIESERSSASLMRGKERQVQASAAELAAKLSRWPALNARNLHDFRLKVKQLRSVVRLVPATDRTFVAALGTVKDRIGDWHDWQQLAKTAAEVLDAQQDRTLLSAIQEAAEQKLREALASANVFRERYLQPVSKKPPASERRLPAQVVTAHPNQAA
jgi:CHAD domain-containing protein